MMLHRIIGLGAVALALCSAAPAAEEADVTIDNFTFGPQVLTVHPGTRVVWKNEDDIPHLVVSADGTLAFRSHALDTDDSYAMTFDKAGTYSYYCGLHPYMQGTVVVK